MPRLSAFLLLSLLILCGSVGTVSAAQYDVSIGSGDVSFSPPELILGTATRIYATVTNNGEKDVEGTVRFYDSDQLIGAKPFSVRASVRPEDAWVPWTPQGYGPHTIRIVVDNDASFMDAIPTDNAVSIAIFVDRDTDGDGVPDRGDDDQDNDLILNIDEVSRGTNPLRADSDGDGVSDRTDAFPLDPRRTVTPPPAPTSTPRVIAPTSTRRPVATPTPVTTRALGLPVLTTSPTLAVITSSTEPVLLAEPFTTSTKLVETPAMSVTDSEIGSSTSSTVGSTPGSSPWNWVLIAAAALSAVAAGLFIWLGHRPEEG